MRRALLVLGLAACYSPKVAEGVACAPAGTERCPAGQVCVTRGGLEVCEPAGATSEDAGIDAAADAADGPGLDGAVPAGWWNTAWTHRRRIDVTAGAHGAQAGYSLAVMFDHFDLVAAGQAKASGDDVRIVRDDGTEVARVLDTGAAWNSVITKLWFPNANAQAVGGTATFWLYWGNPGAGAPPASASAVFVLSDDFEAGLTAWSPDSGVAITGVRPHRGAHSVQIGPLSAMTAGAFAPAVSERDLAFDVWCNIDDTTNVDAFMGVRRALNEAWFADLQPPLGVGGPSTWDISKVASGMYSEAVPPPSGAVAVMANTWTRVTMYAYQDQLAVDVNDARAVPASGFASVSSMGGGSVGIGGYTVPSHVWFDDATVRRFVIPEPSVVLGAIESLP